ncbi:Phosphatidylinositol:ceramide inositolphosphotransferase [Hondaea fermentalgiana]|uniref:Phosphatidylinositol:ceramide inositolphosphotransferase n=1 Tax=Hondaea fermentalgiana TaxID=2315210 RepID=A0A2R5GU93_9STRA|nr:Phosphatidylinositol:ceramide inositolphosphotransferase [Hondaea fermentalgiana]|eukprot:GBG31464.1 Phosphatidylinositol:ceramide inositolphosphotransferase [Hondaea fermentalgiana]
MAERAEAERRGGIAYDGDDGLAAPLLRGLAALSDVRQDIEGNDEPAIENAWVYEEALRLRKRAPQLVAGVAYLAYFGMMVFRNLAFYRVDTSADTYLIMLVLGHSLRFATYITTSLPGPTEMCLEASAADARPKTPLEIFITRMPWRVEANCGDLLFSGRIFQAAVIWKFFQRHAREVFAWSAFSHYLSLATLALLTLLMALFMLLRRNTYSEDIVLGLAIAPLLYHFITHKFGFR